MSANTIYRARVLVGRAETVEVSAATKEEARHEAMKTEGAIAVLEIEWKEPDCSCDLGEAPSIFCPIHGPHEL